MVSFLPESTATEANQTRTGVGRRLVISLGGQGAASALNFLITILLARQLGPEAFGVFALVWLFFILATNLQQGIVIAPMFAIAPGISRYRQAQYLGAVGLIQLTVSAAGILMVAAAWLVLDATSSGARQHLPSLLPVVLAIAVHQLQLFSSRVTYLRGRAELAAVSDVVRNLATLAVIVSLAAAGHLDVVNAFWAITCGALLGLLVTLASGARHVRPGGLRLRFYAHQHIVFARWYSPAVLLQWANANYVVAMSGFLFGPATSGILRACQLMPLVITTLTAGFDNILPAESARVRNESGSAVMERYLWRTGGIALFTTAAVVALLAFKADWVLLLVYGEDYQQYVTPFQGFSLVAVVNVAAYFLQVYLRTSFATRWILFANLGAAISTIAIYHLMIGHADILVAAISAVILATMLRIALLVHGSKVVAAGE